jgi:polygalacturonase
MQSTRPLWIAPLLVLALGCGANSSDPTPTTTPADSAGAGGSGGQGGPDAGAGAVADSSPSGSGSGGTGSTDSGSGGDAHGDSTGASVESSESGVLSADASAKDATSLDAGGVGWDTVPTILARIVAPTFNNVDCDITQYGGVGDGTTDNTAAFAAAIAACVAGGGGRVVVPKGVFFTGPIELMSNIDLYVSPGATIKFTTDPSKYLPVVEVSWEGSLAMNYRPLIWAHDATNVAITGTGTIDGNASTSDWYAWKSLQTPDQDSIRMQNAMGVAPAQRVYGAGHYLRPGLIEFMHCTNVLFDGFTAQNSPFWTIHPVFCTNVTARNFHSLGSQPNTDGFDPESCTDVLVQNATIQVGDDAIAIKAGRDRDGFTYYQPSQNIVIQNSNLLTKHGGFTIGSEMSAGVQNVYIEQSTISDSSGNILWAINLRTAVTRGGYIRDVYARQITVATVGQFFQMTSHFVSGSVIGPQTFTDIGNINLDGVTVASSTSSPFFIDGADTTKPAAGIHFNNVTIASSPSPALATGSGHYTNLTTTGVVVNGAPFNPPASAP